MTGNNLRNILLLTDWSNIDQLTAIDALSIRYKRLREEDTWRIGVIRDFFEIRSNNARVAGFELEELKSIFEFACID